MGGGGGGVILMYGSLLSFKRPSKKIRTESDPIDVTFLEELYISPHKPPPKHVCIDESRGLIPSLFGKNGGGNIKMYLFFAIGRPFLGHNNNPGRVSPMLTNL